LFVCVAAGGVCTYPNLALPVHPPLNTVRRGPPRQIVDFTPGRLFVMPSVRRTPVVKGVPRSRWLNTVGCYDQLVAWLKPKTRPAWLAPQMLAALLVLREVRYHIGTQDFRSRQVTLVTTLLDAEGYPVAELAELYRRR